MKGRVLGVLITKPVPSVFSTSWLTSFTPCQLPLEVSERYFTTLLVKRHLPHFKGSVGEPESFNLSH